MKPNRSDKKATRVKSSFQVCWWDRHEGIGIATDAIGNEYVLHRSNISSNLAEKIKSGVTLTAVSLAVGDTLSVLTEVKAQSLSPVSAFGAQRRETIVEAA